MLVATNCLWQHTLFAEPSSVHRQTYICWDVSHRIQRSDNYDKPWRHCWCEDTTTTRSIASDTSGGLSPQRGWEFSIHINVVFKNVVCKLHSNVRRGCIWHDVNKSVMNFVRRQNWQSKKITSTMNQRAVSSDLSVYTEPRHKLFIWRHQASPR